MKGSSTSQATSSQRQPGFCRQGVKASQGTLFLDCSACVVLVVVVVQVQRAISAQEGLNEKLSCLLRVLVLEHFQKASRHGAYYSISGAWRPRLLSQFLAFQPQSCSDELLFAEPGIEESDSALVPVAPNTRFFQV